MLLQAMNLFHLPSLQSSRCPRPRHIASRCTAQLRQLATVRNNNRLASLATGTAKGFDLLNYIHALGDTAKDNVLAVQPLGLDCAQEELQYTRTHCQQKPPAPSKSRYTCNHHTQHYIAAYRTTMQMTYTNQYPQLNKQEMCFHVGSILPVSHWCWHQRLP